MDLKQIEKTIVLQHDASDCGVACLLSLIRYYDGEMSLAGLREISGTTKQGTTLLGLYQAALQIGFKAEGCEADVQSLIDHGAPVILHLLLDGKFQHYVVCYGYENDRFWIADPSKGLVFYTKRELEQKWISHTCLTLTCTDRFIRKKEIEEKKKKWLLRILSEDLGILSASVGLGLGVAVLGMTTAIFTQKLVDVIIPEKDFPRLWGGLCLVFLLLLARLGLAALRQFLLFAQSRDFNNRIIEAFYTHLLRLPRSFFDTRKIGELVARLNDTRRIQQVISVIAGNIIIDGLVAIVTLAFLFYYSWIFAVLILCGLPFFIYLVYKCNGPLILAQRNVMVGYAQSESNFISTMQGIDSIKNFNKQQTFESLNKAIYGVFQENVFQLGKINIRLSFVSGLISLLLIITSIGLGSYFVLRDNLKLGELMAVISLVASISPAIVNLSLIAIPLNEAKVAFNRMFEFVGINTENAEGTTISKVPISIEMENLSFRFPGRKRILENISLTAYQNEIIFIIGESGCGKSTLCKIIEKSYKPEAGSIVLDGNLNLSNISLDSWRNVIGVIPQDVFIFNGTVLDNISLGAQSGNIESVLNTCSQWGIDKYIQQLPQGYMTVVGEEGINLSGGQKQLIALTRLLIKDPAIMILDEPTAAMDRDMERFTLNILQTLKKQKIIIFISHRLHILKNYADRIYLIEDGKINHFGTHEEMIQTDNLYSSYWDELIDK
ncbi:peptidase domain-containing ABC transporter [uncultured Parabacteroides sp.]|jgi:ABC-type bacteriocin/lantibiotic exporter with double-glycine peptidase domain|uniref:peptidase domain-containing ABC transporter n=1 Tax=uncultured Parabacteroides sp. TaxID=512312 RepID=UPI0025D07BC2|nr:peptidase domain-containing ABC transporter [uncultured Parabacteroides sp.]